MGHAPLRESLASLLLIALGPVPAAPLIDPMCGSGTFLTEGLDFFKTNSKREFSYQNFPMYIELKNKLVLAPANDQKIFKNFLGFDIDTNPTHPEIIFAKKDIFTPEESKEKRPVIILNPPYGKRVGDKNEINLSYYQEILASVKTNYSPLKIGIIIPEEYPLKSKKDLTIVRSYRFKNGGIPVVFYVLTCK